MKKLPICFVLWLLASCQYFEQNNNYRIITSEKAQKLKILDTLVNNSKVVVFKIGDSVSDLYPHILIRPKLESKGKNYFFDEAEIENDSIIRCYYSAFVYDDEGGFRKNGIWVYTKFYTEGSIPFKSSCMEFSVDSIPANWKKELPTKEGIYFYQNKSLKLISKEQSEKKFKEAKKNGFYFIPNKGRLFERLNINKLQ